MLDASQIRIELKAHTKLLRKRAIVKRLRLYTNTLNIEQISNRFLMKSLMTNRFKLLDNAKKNCVEEDLLTSQLIVSNHNKL